MPWTTEQTSALLTFSSNKDMDAINQYFIDHPPTNTAANMLVADWASWWANLSWWDKNISTDAFDAARNKVNAYMIANAPPAQQPVIKQVIAEGITTEEMEGQPKRADAQGNLPVPPPPGSLASDWQKFKTFGLPALAITILAGVALGVSKLVSNPLAILPARKP